MKTTTIAVIPVLPSTAIERDVKWYQKQTGFIRSFGDDRYAGLQRDNLVIHLQWHADTADDPLLGGSVVRIFVKNIQPLFDEFVERGTVTKDKLKRNTAWKTNEFGFYDLNKNGIFVVEDAK